MNAQGIDIGSLEKELSELKEEELLKDQKILEILLSKRIYRIRFGDHNFYVYRSGREDYLIIPRVLCTCPDFLMNVIMRRRKGSCIHLKALEIAIKKSYFKEIVFDKERFERALYSLVLGGRLSEDLPQE